MWAGSPVKASPCCIWFYSYLILLLKVCKAYDITSRDLNDMYSIFFGWNIQKIPVKKRLRHTHPAVCKCMSCAWAQCWCSMHTCIPKILCHACKESAKHVRCLRQACCNRHVPVEEALRGWDFATLSLSAVLPRHRHSRRECPLCRKFKLLFICINSPNQGTV